jgi:hypothetical protein
VTSAVPDLDALERLLAGATDAPWQWLDSGGDPGEYDELQDGNGEMVASGFRDDINLREPGTPGQITDGRLCAEMRNNLSALIARVRQLEDAARAVLPEVMEAELGSAIDAPTIAQSMGVIQAKANRWLRLRAALNAAPAQPAEKEG